MFIIDFNRPPTSDADLVPSYIAAVPRTPYASPEPWSYYSVGDRALYQMSITDPELCKAINYASNSFGYAIIPGFQERSVDEGCYQNNSLGLIYLKWYSIRR